MIGTPVEREGVEGEGEERWVGKAEDSHRSGRGRIRSKGQRRELERRELDLDRKD